MSNRLLAGSERVRCRNAKCRSKLPIPTSNDHKAFCTPYCYDQFYHWRCKVCEETILKGRRRKQPDHCRAKQCRKEFRRYPEAFSYPYSPTCNYDPRSAHFTGVKSAIDTGVPALFGSTPMRSWHWDDTIVEHEHWLYAYGRVVAIVCSPAHPLVVDAQAEGEWTIRYPVTFPVQTATTLGAARKLAINVALWTWPVGGVKPKPAPQEKISEAEWRERDAADEQYVLRDEERLRTEPVNSSGNYALRGVAP